MSQRVTTTVETHSAVNDSAVDYRTALVLHAVEGLSSAEIGQVFGVGVSAAKSRIHRARSLARKWLRG